MVHGLDARGYMGVTISSDDKPPSPPPPPPQPPYIGPPQPPPMECLCDNPASAQV